MMIMRRLTSRLTPLQTLLMGFLLLEAVGGLLLVLPISSKNGRFQPFLDALFMASSTFPKEMDSRLRGTRTLGNKKQLTINDFPSIVSC